MTFVSTNVHTPPEEVPEASGHFHSPTQPGNLYPVFPPRFILWSRGVQCASEPQQQLPLGDLPVLQIHPGHPLADGAGQLIGDGPRLGGHGLHRVPGPEDLHLVPHVHPGQIRQVDHGHIHADAAPLGRGTLGGHQAAPAGQAPEEPVGIAVGHHAHAGAAPGGEQPSITDGGAGLIGLGGADGGFQGHHRPQVQPLGKLPIPIQQQARAHHVQVHLRIAGGGPGVGAVAQGEAPAALFLHRPDHPAEQVKLPAGIGHAVRVRLIGHGKVGEDALGLQPRQGAGLADALHAAVKVAAVAEIAQPGHAGIHLDVDLQRAAQGRGLMAVFQGLGLAGDGLGNVVLYQPPHLLLGGVAQDQHRAAQQQVLALETREQHYDSLRESLEETLRALDTENQQLTRQTIISPHHSSRRSSIRFTGNQTRGYTLKGYPTKVFHRH